MDPITLVCRNGAAVSTCATQPAHHPEGTPLNRPDAPPLPPLNRKGRAALVWGVGSTLLSGLGFIALALFEQYNSSLSELRSDLKHFNETSASFVKRESLQRFRDQVNAHFKEHQSASALRVQLEHELRASEKAREEMARELQQLRERLAFVEGQQAVPSSAQRPGRARNKVPD